MKTTSLSILFIFFLVVSTVLFSCEKDEPNNPNNPNTNETYVFDKGNATTGSFIGQVINESNQAMGGVYVSVGNESTTTDANGVFYIENALVYENLAYIKAEKHGYFFGSRSITPKDGINKVRIMMLEKEQIGTFDASAGGTVNGNGISIDFEEGIVDADGNSYTGTVHVAAKYLDPESDHFLDYMPGNLIAADADGNKYLESFGMVGVELTDDSGNELQPAEGKKATVSFPLSSSLLSDAPNTIDLWHFSSNDGYWVYEGTANLEGNVYKAEISHFSFWNCDVSSQTVTLNGQVVDINNNGISDLKVKIVSDNFGETYDFTSSTGNFGGIVPANENLTIEIYINCGGTDVLIYSQNIGTLTSNTYLTSIVLSANNSMVYVSGTLVDCSYNPVSNGYVVNQAGNVIIVNNGMFNTVACANTTFSIQGFDLDNMTESGINNYAIDTSNTNIGQILACNSISAYIQWNVDGINYLATVNLETSIQGNNGTISGAAPDAMQMSLYPFNGVGTYSLDSVSQHVLWGDSPLDSMYSHDITLNITQYGTNTGDLIEGNFSGTYLRNGAPHNLTGSLHFFKD